jgi:hypothetical protein
MAYQNITFPTIGLIHGWRIVPDMPTTVVGNYSSEYRINRFANEKNTFIYPARNIRWSDWLALYAFSKTVGWRRDSFKFVRPDNGTTVVVCLVKPITADIVSLDSSNNPTVAAISDIVLIEVFNEVGAPSFTP